MLSASHGCTVTLLSSSGREPSRYSSTRMRGREH